MPRKNWKSISLPTDLMEKIEEMMNKKTKFWSSKADFIKYAVRRLIEINWYKEEGNKGDSP